MVALTVAASPCHRKQPYIASDPLYGSLPAKTSPAAAASDAHSTLEVAKACPGAVAQLSEEAAR